MLRNTSSVWVSFMSTTTVSTDVIIIVLVFTVVAMGCIPLGSDVIK